MSLISTPHLANASSGSSSGSSSTSGSSSSSSSSSSSGSSSSSSEDEEERLVSDETKARIYHAKKEYRDLKFKLLQSIKENEILTDELRRHQRKLLRLNRDKYFLFERLLSYEKPSAKQGATPKEDTIEIVDGVPKVVRVGKKRGPKPKKREPEQPEMNFEPGQSLLKLKTQLTPSSSSGSPPAARRKRGPYKKKVKKEDLGGSVSFSPGFAKERHSPPKKAKGSTPASSSLFPPAPGPPELSNSTTQDSVLSFKSDVGGPGFFRQDSFSNEMPDNLFDD